MILESQECNKIVVDPKVIKTERHDMGKGGYIYADGEIMAYYPNYEDLAAVFAGIKSSLIEGRKSFSCLKE